ncbi:MAG: hypothetical protein R2707_14230 [Acidimicrobiales bacterium]
MSPQLTPRPADLSTTGSSDTLVLDVPAARELVGALTNAAEALAVDHLALRSMLDEATAILRADHTGALVPLTAARQACAGLAADLRFRVDLVERTTHSLDRIDELSRGDSAWGTRERRRLLLGLVGGDVDHARRVERAMAAGHDAAAAFRIVDAELRLEYRVGALMEAFSIDEAAALAMVERVDAALIDLLDRGYATDDAVAALAIVENFGLDLATALDHAAAVGIDLHAALGQMLTARALGVTLAEYVALTGLEEHFAVFDNATGGSRDQRVSAKDLEFVVAHPWRFTPSQVLAAQALLDQPLLRNRLDTANHNADLFSGTAFGSMEPGDGLIADVDLHAFLLKAQLHTILGDYADRIDVANDPSGIVDGFRSENDFRAFIADNPDLPESVLAAATVALESGWFDQTWWDEHKDELAMGAALLAAGLVVVATGGAASMILVVGAGALAGGATTVAINLATGAPILDDALMNSVRGGFIGAGVHGVVTGAAAYGTASTGVARVAAVAGATSGAADVVAAGGVDLLIDEQYEAAVHGMANDVGNVAGAIDLGLSAGEWASRTPVTFDSVEEQLAALSDRISRQRQLRHIKDSPLHRSGGYFVDPADAQRVLDAVHDGSAEVFGITRGQDLLVRYDEVIGIHVNRNGGVVPGIETTTFTVKGSAKPSVVPVRPGRTE